VRSFHAQASTGAPDVARPSRWLPTSLAREAGGLATEIAAGLRRASAGRGSVERGRRRQSWPACLAGMSGVAPRVWPAASSAETPAARRGMARRAAAARDAGATRGSRRASCRAPRVCDARWVRLFPTVDAVLPAQRSEHVEPRCPVAQQGFPGCQLDKPTWRYLTSRRRVSCICRFPLGFLSMFFHRRGRPNPRAAGSSGCRRGLFTSTSHGAVRQPLPSVHTRRTRRGSGGVMLSSSISCSAVQMSAAG
jgi:hypothetical protein